MYNELDYEKFSNNMETTFPKIFVKPYGGFCIDPGWWPIIEELCQCIQSHIDWNNTSRQKLLEDNPYNYPIPEEISQVVVEQIKEKFGGLRFYYQGGDDQIHGMVRMAEAWASRTCEVCGSPGKSRNDGWVKTLCDTHNLERQERRRSMEMKSSGFEE
jgi:hypothetical protein